MLKKLFSILVIPFCLSACNKKNKTVEYIDRLDAVSVSNSKLNKELKDIYRIYKVYHIVTNHIENLFAKHDDGKTYKLKNKSVQEVLKQLETLKEIKYFDEKIDFHSQKLIAHTILIYNGLENNKKIDHTKKKNQALFTKLGDNFKAVLNYTTKKYGGDNFNHMSDAIYWKTIAKSNYIHSKEYKAFEQLILKNNKYEAYKLLRSSIKKTKDNQEKTIYQLKLADQNVALDMLSGGGDNISYIDKSGKIYFEILNRKKYNLYLFETWLKLRALMQQNLSLDVDGEILNDKYDEIREVTIMTVFKYIQKHPKDIFAINQFLLLTTHDIIRRYGDYPYGNQNTVEYHELFDDEKETIK